MNHNWSDYFDISSEYWKKVEKIYEESECFPKKVVKYRNLHHKFPKSFSKRDGVDIDNDDDNLVSLSLSDHFLVHYYLWKCCNKKGYRNLMALAFNFMRKKAIKYASDETIEELAKDYSAVMEDVCEAHRRLHHTKEAKQKISESLKGKPTWNKGKHLSEETRKKLSESKKGKPAWNKGKPSANKGKHWKLIDGKRVWY